MGTSEVVDDESKGRLWLLNGRKRDEAEEATLAVAVAVAVAVEVAAEDRTGSIFLLIFHCGVRPLASRIPLLGGFETRREKETANFQDFFFPFFLFV